MDARAFTVGYMRFNSAEEDIFLSVTPGFEHGPGIQRDGISAPRMTDPHCVSYIANARGLRRKQPATSTVNPYYQRAGTWTLYNHLANFHERLGKSGWQIVGAQGHGDLTMNYWHVAYCAEPALNPHPVFCHLNTVEDHPSIEAYQDRTYRCLVKWKDVGRRPHVEFQHVRFLPAGTGAGVTVHLVDNDDHDVTDEIAFAMAGKTIIENRVELPLEAIIDRFDDVRHVFTLPETPARGFLQGQQISTAILGEYNLFNYINERRATLHAPVVIPLQPKDTLKFDWELVQKTLIEKHFRPTAHGSEIPTLRGQFRKYPGQSGHSECVEVFFPRNVYPFGVIGMRTGLAEGSAPEIIGFSSGGLSGRIGNTLEGVTRVVYDFLACGEAMIVDEGLDVFQLVNPSIGDGENRFGNEEILATVARQTGALIADEDRDCAERFPGGVRLRDLPLNSDIFQNVERSPFKQSAPSPEELFPVLPQRSQMRAVIIFAKRATAGEKE
jgi:hypothetical protein